MAFYRRCSLRTESFSGYNESVYKEVNGEVVSSSVDLSKLKLPPVENYNLGKMIESGVNLQQMNTKVLPPRVDGDIVSDAMEAFEIMEDIEKEQTSEG